MKNTEGKFQILKLGSDVYHFSQRLDPVIWMLDELLAIFSWRSPTLTIGFGIVSTLMIMNLKISLLGITLFLIFGKSILIRKLQKISKKKNVHKRILVPKQNTVFLQASMTTYTMIYEKIHNFCLDEDKTNVINFIHHICQTSLIIFVLLFVISLETLIVMVLWGLLLVASPEGMRLFKEIWPGYLYLEKQTTKFTDKITDYIKLIRRISTQSNEVIKEFYFYQYERWFMGKGWSKSIDLFEYHFADESSKIELFPKTSAPDGWQWLTDHQVDYISSADVNGYQYKNDFSKGFNSDCSFATIRRRKFVRKCKFIFNKDTKKNQ